MMHFTVGQQVRIIDPESRYRNYIGTVLEVFGPVSTRGRYTVKSIEGSLLGNVDPLALESALTFTGPYRVWCVFDCERQSALGDGQGNDKTYPDLDAAHKTARGLSFRIAAVTILDTHNHIITQYREGRELTRAEIFTPRD